ncbi:MAG: response regulator [Candidatus Brocadiae bacterium]|nr:response regulator [Candidatus Brocadiia bacterium]
MDIKCLEVLLVEDNPGDARLIREFLESASCARFNITLVERLSDALSRLAAADAWDVILLDLTLPDSRGLETFIRVRTAGARAPVVVMSGLDDEQVAVRAVEEGAQDYLVKGQATDAVLARALLYAVERHKLQAELKSLAIIDAVTGLYNLRGFNVVGEQVMRLAAQLGRRPTLTRLVFEAIPDTRIGARGDDGSMLLMEIADVLRGEFSDADVLARLRGGDFVALSVNLAPDAAREVAGKAQVSLGKRLADAGVKTGGTARAGIVDVDPSRGLDAAIDSAARALSSGRIASPGGSHRG